MLKYPPDAGFNMHTILAAQRLIFMVSCIGERFGGLIPTLVANDSTYHAEPMPIMSEKVLPRAAAAIVDIVMTDPNMSSI